MSKSLPSRPNLEQLKTQAKELLKQFRAGQPDALFRVREYHPDIPLSSTGALSPSFRLHDAQRVVAREYGFASWPKLKEHVEAILVETVEPMELLKRAFHANDAALLAKLLDRHPQFKAMLDEPIGPFDSPAIAGVTSREMLDTLLDAGADINAKSRWWAGGFGLLHNAEPTLAAYAIQRGAVVDVHAAARLGMLDTLHELIAADPSLVHARGGDGQTPLHFASSVEIAEFLLARGADIDARDIDHESTPAQWMLRDRPEVARYLVRSGCKTDLLMAAALGDVALVRQHLDANPECIHIRVTDEWFPKRNPRSGGTIYQWQLGFHVSAHDVARKFGHEEVYSLLMERSPDELKLIAACWAGDEGAVKSLLAKHPDLPGALSLQNRQQLAHAARNNDLAAARLMLAAGLPVDALGQHRATPLHWACFHGNAAMAREILRYDPPLELKDADFGGTPLGWAIHGSLHGWYSKSGDYSGVVESLLKAGAKPPPRIEGCSEAVREALSRT